MKASEAGLSSWRSRGPKTHRTRAWKRVALLWPLQAALVAAVWGCLAVLPADWAAMLGARLGRTLGPHLRAHRRLRQNLTIALPSATRDEVKALVRDAWGGLGATLCEYPHLGRIARGAEVVCSPDAERHFAAGAPAIFVSAHIGNWEIPVHAVRLRGQPLSIVYREKDNPMLEWLVQRCRQPLDCRYVPSNKGARPLLAELRSGRSVALLVDLRVDSGELLPFFGRPTHTTLAPARLAQSVGCPLVPARAERLRRSTHRIVVGAPIWPNPQIADRHEQAKEMMTRVNRVVESWITARPQEWASTHHRWPKMVRRLALHGNPTSA